MISNVELIEPLLPPKQVKRGRPRMVAAVRNLECHLLCGAQRMCMAADAHDLPPWQTVYGYYWQWRNEGTGKRSMPALVQRCERRKGEPHTLARPSLTVRA